MPLDVLTAVANAIPPMPDSRPIKNVQFFTPEGHNTWVGDTTCYYHNGRFHVFYLQDRRNHGSKYSGGHYFAHLSTTDMVNWFEHPHAVPITEQWETIGTGTPFVQNGKLHLAIGYHTGRIMDSSSTTGAAQNEYLKENNKSRVFARDEIPGYPVGASYAVSEDGITFKKSFVTLHPSENPSIYSNPDDSLLMYAGYGSVKGTWTSPKLGEPWVCIDTEFPPSHADSFMQTAPEVLLAMHNGEEWAKNSWFSETIHRKAANFAINHIRGMDKPFEVKMLIVFERKNLSTMIDVEIAGQRTMVTRRENMRFSQVSFLADTRDMEDVVIRDVKVGVVK